MQNPIIDLSKLQIRPMTLEDTGQAAQIEKTCFSTPWSQEALKESLLSGRNFYLAAQWEEQIIGECGLHIVCDEGEITNVAVLPQYRQHGIAKALLAELLKQGQRLGVQDFTLEVRAGNVPAVRLYEKFDFQTEGIRRNFYEKPREDAMIMWKRQAVHGTITT